MLEKGQHTHRDTQRERERERERDKLDPGEVAWKRTEGSKSPFKCWSPEYVRSVAGLC